MNISRRVFSLETFVSTSPSDYVNSPSLTFRFLSLFSLTSFVCFCNIMHPHNSSHHHRRHHQPPPPVPSFDPPFCLVDGGTTSTGGLPRAHTCFNQLVLPHGLQSFDELCRKFDDALSHTKADGGGFFMT
jgi:hypothetical protein